MSEIKIVTVIGARPQFIKVAPVSRAIDHHNLAGFGPHITEILVHTGQHYDHNMSQIFFDQLELCHPKYNLGVGSGSHGKMTGAMLSKIEKVLINEKPDWVLVYGDTNSTLAGALAAVKLQLPVAHVEAGLRSFNRRMPEEINRIITDHISTILFCPTDNAVLNLKKEGITNGVFKVGDVMYDAFLFNKAHSNQGSTIVSDLDLKPGNYCLATLHRQENTENEERLTNIFSAFESLSSEKCPFVVPLHPRTSKVLQGRKAKNSLSSHIRLLSPISYLDMISLEIHARVVLTDSGGIQKEAYFAKVPCVTLRDETEWVGTVESGWNHLAGTEPERIVRAFRKATNSNARTQSSLFGDGTASDILLRKLICNSSLITPIHYNLLDTNTSMRIN